MHRFTLHFQDAMWWWRLRVLILFLILILDLRYQQCQMRKRTLRPPCSGITLGSTQCSQTLTTLHASSSSEEWQTVWAFNVKYGYRQKQLMGKRSSVEMIAEIARREREKEREELLDAIPLNWSRDQPILLPLIISLACNKTRWRNVLRTNQCWWWHGLVKTPPCLLSC